MRISGSGGAAVLRRLVGGAAAAELEERGKGSSCAAQGAGSLFLTACAIREYAICYSEHWIPMTWNYAGAARRRIVICLADWLVQNQKYCLKL